MATLPTRQTVPLLLGKLISLTPEPVARKVVAKPEEVRTISVPVAVKEEAVIALVVVLPRPVTLSRVSVSVYPVIYDSSFVHCVCAACIA